MATATTTTATTTFKRNAHGAYFRRCLQALPAQATGYDSNRLTIAYFCLAGLDLLDVLEQQTSEDDRKGWIEWTWSLQARKSCQLCPWAWLTAATGGFRGSTYMTTPNPDTSPGHLPSTYTALLTLAILRAPLDRLDLPALRSFLSSCQGPDGSQVVVSAYGGIMADPESDLRMTYCASVVADITDSFSSIDTEAALEVIARSKTWEGGYAARPGVVEAQGGTSYCGLASRSLLCKAGPKKASTLAHQDDAVRWLLQRQIGGFQGRPGKLQDVCYSFWCGAGLSIIGHGDLVNAVDDRAFLLSAQSPIGGFGKDPEEFPDPLHSYLAIAALALHDRRQPAFSLPALNPTWNVTQTTTDYLESEMKRIST